MSMLDRAIVVTLSNSVIVFNGISKDYIENVCSLPAMTFGLHAELYKAPCTLLR